VSIDIVFTYLSGETVRQHRKILCVDMAALINLKNDLEPGSQDRFPDEHVDIYESVYNAMNHLGEANECREAGSGPRMIRQFELAMWHLNYARVICLMRIMDAADLLIVQKMECENKKGFPLNSNVSEELIKARSRHLEVVQKLEQAAYGVGPSTAPRPPSSIEAADFGRLVSEVTRIAESYIEILPKLSR